MRFKPFLCTMLTVILLLACVGCQNQTSDKTSTGAEANSSTAGAFGTVENDETDAGTPAPTEEQTPQATEEPTEEKPENTTSAIEVPATNAPSSDDRFIYTFEPVNDTVYTTADLNIRREPYNDAEIVTVAPKGTALTRVGYQEYWCQIIYNGEILYVGTAYLTTTAP